MTRPDTAALGRRADAVRRALAEAPADALVVTNLRNIRYLSNFDGSTAIVLLTRARLYLLSDFRYSAAIASLTASRSAPPATEFVLVEGSYDEALASLIERECARQRVGIESAHMTVKQYGWLAERLARAAPDPVSEPPKLVPLEAVVEGRRLVKDEWELETLRAAGRLLSSVAREVLVDVVRPGPSEREMAADIDARLTRAGFDGPAFDTIVATGPTSALPHAHPGDRRGAIGEVVLVDFGGVYHGYAVDLTRTVTLGSAPPDVAGVYRAVYEAQRAAIDAIRPGVGPDAVDAAARDVLTRAGLGERFGHGTGHGLGLDVHEEPRLGKRRDSAPPSPPLAPGMVCTIEPGAYLTGRFGVRLEDDIIVTETGAELITDVPFDTRLLQG